MSQEDVPSRPSGAIRQEDGPWNVELMHRTTPARIAPPRRTGHRSRGWIRRKEIAMTTMTELREVDRDELVNVEGGTYGDDNPGCGFHPPGWHPPVLGS
jgi:hypothetical protein